MRGNSSRSHTKPALGAEAINYLGEEGQGKWSIAGWGEKRQAGGGGHTHSYTGFEAETTLQESKHWQWQERGRASEGEGIQSGEKQEKFNQVFPTHTQG